MIVLTADQVDSRSTPDLAGALIEQINERHPTTLLLPADRTAGDEIQLITDSGRATVDLVLELSRSRQWSVGCGVGSVVLPLADSIRASSGDAFVAAREAVERAKRRATRFAIAALRTGQDARGAEALIDLVLTLRRRRSPEGWELYDLLAEGLTQAEAASKLGISPQAVSKRALAADLRFEAAAIAPLARIVDTLSDRSGAGFPTDEDDR